MTRLEFLRRQEKLSQVKLAKELGYSSGWYLVHLERYRPDPKAIGKELRAALEKRFRMTLEKLLEPAEMR